MTMYIITVDKEVEKAFTTEEKARNYVDTKYSWIKQSCCPPDVRIQKVEIED